MVITASHRSLCCVCTVHSHTRCTVIIQGVLVPSARLLILQVYVASESTPVMVVGLRLGQLTCILLASPVVTSTTGQENHRDLIGGSILSSFSFLSFVTFPPCYCSYFFNIALSIRTLLFLLFLNLFQCLNLFFTSVCSV